MPHQDWQHLYKTARWRKTRARQLAKHPYCQCPHCRDRRIPATVVDHIEPHKGDLRLFFDSRNLQSMTKRCHDSYKQSQEQGGAGFMRGCNESGEPLNRDHPWYA